jgi:twitching motility protein PilT
MNIALQAAETGHLVFATVHTASAAETLDRISNMYQPHERPMLWLRLSVTLRGVLSQKLIARADGSGRVAAIEVMDVTPTIVTMLEKGQSDDIYSAIRQAGNEAYWGMQTMNQCLLRFYKAGIITEQDALANAGQFTELRQMIRMAFNKGEVALPGQNPQTAYQQQPQQPQRPQQPQQPQQQQRSPGIPPMPPRAG